jgi:hypothetical protein
MALNTIIPHLPPTLNRVGGSGTLNDQQPFISLLRSIPLPEDSTAEAVDRGVECIMLMEEHLCQT